MTHPAPTLDSDSVLRNCGVDPDVLRSSIARWMAITLDGTRRVVFAGSNPLIDAALAASPEARPVVRYSLAAASALPAESYDLLVVIEDSPTPDAWAIIASLAQRPRVQLVWEALRQDLLVSLMATKFQYLVTPEELLGLMRNAPGTSSRRLDRPIVKADAIESFQGKRVIEFGPLDGVQTAAIAKLGASEIVCIEIRPDNYLKSLLSADLIGARQVSIRFDNFHAVTAARYGTFDICIAHGVYYHSNAPFRFLENIASLAPVVVFGGFCATDASPAGDWMELASEGQSYRAKQYAEVNYFTAGVSANGYFFGADAIQRWFRNHGFEICALEVRSTTSKQPAGEFVFFVAKRAR
ncbi:MAG: hypothetical protein JNM94_09215 [Phycisphaerae bacterium]|nr:hypothetical protein [Phycisphaerae bacterium]